GADLLVMLTDGREGLVPGDERIARELRETGRPVLVAINKTDDKRARDDMDFYRLGFEPVFEISAEHGHGVAELLDAIVEKLRRGASSAPTRPEASSAPTRSGASSVPTRSRQGSRRTESDRVGAELARPLDDAPSHQPSAVSHDSERETRVAIVGRPNVGKSSLVNRLLRAERVLVSDMPGTTRDAIDVPLTWHRRRFRIVDTAGMRRPGRVASGGKVELVSVALAKESIADADVVALMIDAKEGAADQDAAIGGEVDRAGRGIVIVANKWDLMKGRDPGFVKTFDEQLRQKMRFLDYAPILHISATTGERAGKVLETID